MDSVVRHFDKPVAGQKCAFILTASEAEQGDKWWLREDRDALTSAGFDVFDYTLTGKTSEDVAQALKDADVLFVAGGKTFYLLGQAQKNRKVSRA